MSYSQSYRRVLHKLGYYDYQSGLIYRHLNQENGWDSHLEKCRDFILRATDFIKPEKITVLGSGWLLELPLAELAERTREIVLIDIIHPPQVREQVKELKNVGLKEQDVSGGLVEEVWRIAAKSTFINRLISLDKIRIPEYHLTDAGMVISLNVLTQIETLPVRFLRKKARVTENEFTGFRKKIQESHLNFLRKHKSVLVTDTREVFTGTSGIITENQTVITDLPVTPYTGKWKWDFDLRGSDYRMKRSVFEVTGLILDNHEQEL